MASTIALVPLGEDSFIPGMMTHAGGEKPGGMPAAGPDGLCTRRGRLTGFIVIIIETNGSAAA